VRTRLKMPVLCLVGEDDVLIPPRTIKAIAALLPNARVATVPDCGHSIYFEQPAIFNQLVREFLNEIGYSGGAP
ncbi:MAG: alpha/beta fold hydrolase, partial [Candidatus Binataceae bacterium]